MTNFARLHLVHKMMENLPCDPKSRVGAALEPAHTGLRLDWIVSTYDIWSHQDVSVTLNLLSAAYQSIGRDDVSAV